MSRIRARFFHAKLAELKQRVKVPGPLDNTPQNRRQRRQADKVLRRMEGAKAAKRKQGK
jgi:hypothetical protein